jgi:hypothetical protein
MCAPATGPGTFYKWKSKFDGLEVSEAKRLRLLEDENAKLKKLLRIYREEALRVRRRGVLKRAVGTRAPAPMPTLRNQRWNLDFVHDQMVTGRRFRVLNIVDDPTRECLAAIPIRRYRAKGWCANWLA